jgi:hypothetical protein
MYRIELSPGEETVFRSIEELAVAIKRGVVTPRARIYHNASSRWLPIQFHPHYQAAVSMPLTQAALVAGPPVKPLSTLTLNQPADPEPPLVASPAPLRIAGMADQPVQQKRARSGQPAREKRSRRRSKPRRQLRIALVGALLVGGAQWVLSAPLFSRTEGPALIEVQRRLIAAPANTAAMVPHIRTPVPSTAPAYFGGIAPSQAVTAGSPAPTPPPLETAATSEIEPIPSSIDVSLPSAPSADSLASKIADSTNQKTMKRILRAVSGTPGKEKPPAKR